MKWTKDKPKVDGYYWYRDKYTAKPKIHGYSAGIVYPIGINEEYYVEEFNGEWAGPIPLPREEEDLKRVPILTAEDAEFCKGLFQILKDKQNREKTSVGWA